MDKIIKVKNISKKFKDTGKVLDNISFRVLKGQNVGIIGPNGSGKTTLLLIMAGIYQADEGQIEKDGKILYLGGYGFATERSLTMKENIYLKTALLGLSKKETDSVYQEIVDFSGLNKHQDGIIEHFSSGMIARLNFSITINSIKFIKPDIIILDEVLGAGGDMYFREAALERIRELMESEITIVMVSHRMGRIRRFCNRVFLLKDGQIVKRGKPKEVIEYYKNL
jgi:ABC-type polysaccharide/polyol phosphate transport system ATPase subunit